MTESPIAYPQSPSKRLSWGALRWVPYVGFGLVLNAGIWAGTTQYLKNAKPSYTSQWAMMLPGSGPGVNVNLPNIGQAYSATSSPFGSSTSDPRANYQFLVTSQSVIASAAQSLNISEKEFGKPQVKLLDNSTIMQLQVPGSTPEIAKQKSQALYKAFDKQLQRLRLEEIAFREQGTQNTLDAARSKLSEAEQRVAAYEANAGLSFPEQLKDLSGNIEHLRRQHVETVANYQQSAAKLQRLTDSLGVSPQLAADAFILNADPVLQQTFKDYSDATAKLTVLQSKWGEKHPEVAKELGRRDAALSDAVGRAEALVGRSLDDVEMGSLQLGGEATASRATLFRDLVALQAEQQGYRAQGAALETQITELEARLDGMAKRQAGLNSLKRDVQTAEAVFGSTVAKLDLGKSDIFAAYPLVQLIEQPSLPEQPSSPQKPVILAGAGGASLFATLGLMGLALRSGRRKDKTVEQVSNANQLATS